MKTDKGSAAGRGARLLLAILAIGLCVTGCMNRGAQEKKAANEGQAVQPSPSASANYMPQGTTMDSAVGGAARFDWSGSAAQVEQQIGQISEVSEARVVVTGDTALVGVTFNQAYQGEMTERIREMVAAEVMKADPQITTVAVTADREDVDKVRALSDRVIAGEKMDDLKEEISEIVRNATTLR